MMAPVMATPAAAALSARVSSSTARMLARSPAVSPGASSSPRRISPPASITRAAAPLTTRTGRPCTWPAPEISRRAAPTATTAMTASSTVTLISAA